MFEELDNQMILDLDGTEVRFDTNFQSRDNRRIELEYFAGRAEDGSTVWLMFTISHVRGGLYRLSIHRQQVKDRIISVRLMADRYPIHTTYEVGARYSDRNLEQAALSLFNTHTSPDALRTMIQWAEELVA